MVNIKISLHWVYKQGRENTDAPLCYVLKSRIIFMIKMCFLCSRNSLFKYNSYKLHASENWHLSQFRIRGIKRDTTCVSSWDNRTNDISSRFSYVGSGCKKHKELLRNRAKEVIVLRKQVWVADMSSISFCVTANWGREKYIGSCNRRDRKRISRSRRRLWALKGYTRWTTKGHLPVCGVGADHVLILLTNSELQTDSTSSNNSRNSSQIGE